MAKMEMRRGTLGWRGGRLPTLRETEDRAMGWTASHSQSHNLRIVIAFTALCP